MNYYILTSSQYNNIDKNFIRYKHGSIDASNILVATTETVPEYTRRFYKASTCSKYTLDNQWGWSRDGGGIEEFELLYGSQYIQGIDD